MAKLDICTCLVDLNEFTTVARGELNPLNYAEVELLRFVVGERAIRDLKVLKTVEATNQEVLEGLRLRYGKRQVGEAFPGTRPRLPMEAPSDVPRLDEPPVSAAAMKKRAQRAKAKAAAAEEEASNAEDTLGDVFETSEES